MAVREEDVTIESCIRGYHVYRVTWDPELHVGEVLPCAREPANVINRYAICLVKKLVDDGALKLCKYHVVTIIFLCVLFY